MDLLYMTFFFANGQLRKKGTHSPGIMYASKATLLESRQKQAYPGKKHVEESQRIGAKE